MDTVLDEAAVDAFVANNSFSTGAHTVDTTYTAGAGLVLAGERFSADTALVQARVSSSCAADASISAIAADGTVTCEAITGAPSVTINSTAVGTLSNIEYDSSIFELTFTTSTGHTITGTFY